MLSCLLDHKKAPKKHLGGSILEKKLANIRFHFPQKTVYLLVLAPLRNVEVSRKLKTPPTTTMEPYRRNLKPSQKKQQKKTGTPQKISVKDYKNKLRSSHTSSPNPIQERPGQCKSTQKFFCKKITARLKNLEKKTSNLTAS